MIVVNNIFQIILIKMAAASLSLILSSSEEEEEVVERGRPTSPEVPLQAKLLWSEGNAAYVYAQLLNILS